MAEAPQVEAKNETAAAIPAARPRPTIRPVEPDDAPAIHSLLTASIPDVLSDRERWLARWHWQYWNNPYRQGRPAGFVLAEGDRVLGHLGAVYLPIRVGPAHHTGVIGADYAVSEQGLARAGVFAALELAQRLFTECADCLIMATTANEKTGAVFGRFGCRPVEWSREFWRASTSLHQQFRTCCGGTSRVLRRAFNTRFGPLLMRALVRGYGSRGRGPAIPIRYGCWLETTVPQLARDLGQLWENLWTAAHHGKRRGSGKVVRRVAVHRSQEYLDWRYGSHPERDHIRVLVVRNSGGRPLGAAIVFRERRDDRHVVYVEDLLVPSRRRDVARTLLCAALRLAHQGGAEYLVTSPGHRAFRDLYWELGFESRARNAPAVVIGSAESNASDGPSLPDAIEDHFEFWHGMMF
ncbi:MAG TPA: hypothetical protein PL151_05095 [Phycisphaerae bacterium]|nr:hypothetical protein [Phycisphaerae bacterium]HOJ75907.1 hypothetical protein [Phycisphaerae bacterium]HOM52317.1 hypothetical protein [Phycisphaerae bacterium]HON65657.1 hypothetical protein [Phycisphaerae bacterium]HOQ84641.1 hypothetical protein [Phycisphaerae bacterium]